VGTRGPVAIRSFKWDHTAPGRHQELKWDNAPPAPIRGFQVDHAAPGATQATQRGTTLARPRRAPFLMTTAKMRDGTPSAIMSELPKGGTETRSPAPSGVPTDSGTRPGQLRTRSSGTSTCAPGAISAVLSGNHALPRFRPIRNSSKGPRSSGPRAPAHQRVPLGDHAAHTAPSGNSLAVENPSRRTIGRTSGKFKCDADRAPPGRHQEAQVGDHHAPRRTSGTSSGTTPPPAPQEVPSGTTRPPAPTGLKVDHAAPAPFRTFKWGPTRTPAPSGTQWDHVQVDPRALPPPAPSGSSSGPRAPAPSGTQSGTTRPRPPSGVQVDHRGPRRLSAEVPKWVPHTISTPARHIRRNNLQVSPGSYSTRALQAPSGTLTARAHQPRAPGLAISDTLHGFRRSPGRHRENFRFDVFEVTFEVF